MSFLTPNPDPSTRDLGCSWAVSRLHSHCIPTSFPEVCDCIPSLHSLPGNECEEVQGVGRVGGNAVGGNAVSECSGPELAARVVQPDTSGPTHAHTTPAKQGVA